MAQDGPRIAEISAEKFRDFARRHATSPEIGPIQTSLDAGTNQEIDFDRVLVGLWGCENLCAVACFHLYESAMDKTRHVLKLDSVIVGTQLRRRGLAGRPEFSRARRPLRPPQAGCGGVVAGRVFARVRGSGRPRSRGRQGGPEESR